AVAKIVAPDDFYEAVERYFPREVRGRRLGESVTTPTQIVSEATRLRWFLPRGRSGLVSPAAFRTIE
ncbi:MAG TPA: hypothetical protein VKB78_12465, partial [Pirellulales bacterium]|nr:hypothetical protein [Pirellulales bacterium]